MPRTLVLRTDGGPQRGTGHVMRCLALAETWTQDEGRSAHFISAEINDELQTRIEGLGHDVTLLNGQAGSQTDRKRSSEIARQQFAMVVDGYHFSPRFLRSLTEATTTLYIDDLRHQSAYPVDFILHPIPGREPDDFAGRLDRTQCLLGPDFTLLRPEFNPFQDWVRTHPDEPERLMISMGGTDPDDVTTSVLSAVQPALEPTTHLDIVIGPANTSEGQVRRKLSESPNNYTVHVDIPDIADLMVEVHMAISAGGTMAWELSYMQLPSLLVQIADNQRPVARGLDRLGAAKDLGTHANLDPVALRRAYRNLRDDRETRLQMGLRGRQVVDGRGTQRVVEELGAT